MKNGLQLVFAGILGGAVALSGSYMFSSPQSQTIHVSTESQPVAATPNAYQQLTTNTHTNINTPKDFTTAADKAMPSVVNITAVTEFKAKNSRELEFYEYFGVKPKPSESTGSGVIISPKGYIVTNNHVVKRATEVEVTLFDKRKFKAKVVGTDPSTDLAVLKIEGASLPSMEFANSDEAKIGEWVLAVGSPFELSSTVTAGIISAKGRDIDILKDRYSIESFIQTDAAVNPGNSGGALVNSSGQLLGINTAIIAPSGTYAGYSFAVPINLVKKVVQDLMQYGEVKRGYLGVMIQDVSTVTEELNLNISEGVYVSELVEDGAAEAAGIKKGDVITEVNTINIKSVPELQEQIGSRNPGDAVTLTVLRDQQEKQLVVKLKN
ncbi:MAG: PDZ domain-containing protein [Aureispira sp.]|nr:PDZ domain-containing protein [Aureispira sp.]